MFNEFLFNNGPFVPNKTEVNKENLIDDGNGYDSD